MIFSCCMPQPLAQLCHAMAAQLVSAKQRALDIPHSMQPTGPVDTSILTMLPQGA